MDDAETYFIQLLFCKNRLLLRREFRALYDALYERYRPVYEEGRAAKSDIGDIAKKFLATI